MFTKHSLRGLFATLLIGGVTMPVVATASPTHEGIQITRSYARTQITDDDNTNGSSLQQTPAGWTATADEGGKPVRVLVTNMGVVVKQQ